MSEARIPKYGYRWNRLIDPIPRGILETIAAVRDYLAAVGIERYFFTGSAAAVVHGVNLGHCEDIDLVVAPSVGQKLWDLVKDLEGSKLTAVCEDASEVQKVATFYFIYKGIPVDVSCRDRLSNAIIQGESVNGVAPLWALYALKYSHRYFYKGGDHRKWHQHMRDMSVIQPFTVAALLNDGTKELYDELVRCRTKETIEQNPSHKISLANGATKKEFFSKYLDKITYHFVHDEVHNVVTRSMHRREVPLYVGMLGDGEEVKCDINKWVRFSHSDKINDVLEECYVIALERGIIPGIWGGKGHKPFDDAFLWAYMRVSTNLTKGWFRDFANTHYDEVMRTFYAANNRESNYATHFLAAVDRGEIFKQ